MSYDYALQTTEIRNFGSTHSSLMDLQEVFTTIFEKRRFGGKESASGSGSDLGPTKIIRQEIPKLLRELGIKTMLDAACGDFHWMKEVELPVEQYIGVDIVDAVIDNNQVLYHSPGRRVFVRRDITKDTLPRADLILRRDCLVHLPLHLAKAAVQEFVASRSAYLLTTTFTNGTANTDVVAGAWRTLNLELPPFNFPKPLRLICEGYHGDGGRFADKSLALWELASLSNHETEE